MLNGSDNIMKDWGERTGGKKRHGGISGYLDVGVGGVGLVGVGWGGDISGLWRF